MCSVYNHILHNNGFICNITGGFFSRTIGGIVDGGSNRISAKKVFLYYGLTGFVIDPVEENRRFLMMVDEEFQRFFAIFLLQNDIFLCIKN